MGRTAGIATDVFFCLFGIFAALFAVAPKQPFGFPARPMLKMEWAAESSAGCMFKLVVMVDGGIVDLSVPDPAFAGFSEGMCRWSTIVDGVNSSAVSNEIVLLTPFRDSCATIEFAGDEKVACAVREGTVLPAFQHLDMSHDT